MVVPPITVARDHVHEERRRPVLARLAAASAVHAVGVAVRIDDVARSVNSSVAIERLFLVLLHNVRILGHQRNEHNAVWSMVHTVCVLPRSGDVRDTNLEVGSEAQGHIDNAADVQLRIGPWRRQRPSDARYERHFVHPQLHIAEAHVVLQACRELGLECSASSVVCLSLGSRCGGRLWLSAARRRCCERGLDCAREARVP
jgi:hypothetical protein